MTQAHQHRMVLRTLARQLLATPVDGGQACERARRLLLTLNQGAGPALQPPEADHPLIAAIWNDEADKARSLIASFVERWAQPGSIDSDPRAFESARELFGVVLQRIIDRLDAGVACLHHDAPIKVPATTGIPEIDQDHVEVFAIIGGLRASIGGGAAQASPRMIDGLLDCIEHHMIREEDLMAQTDYDGMDDHRAEHHRARTLLLGFRNDLQDGRPVLAELVLTFLEYWLGTHVAHTDAAMAAHLSQKLISP